MIKLKDILMENREPVIVGSISLNGVIKSEMTTKSHSDLNIQRGQCWRYNPDTETVYWHGDYSEHDEVDEINISSHLYKKYGYKVSKNVTLEDIYDNDYTDSWNTAHGLYESNENQTFRMYHGGKRWSRIPTEIQPPKKNRYEAGPGIYFTNDYNTARRYAKGSRVVHLVEIDKNFKNLSTVNVPLSDIVNFTKNLNRLRHKQEIIESLKNNAIRMKSDSVSLDILNNLIVNYESGIGNVGVEISNYFVKNGADAHIENQIGDEFWLVVFNPKIIKKVLVIDPSKVTSDFEFLLPNINK